MDILDGKGPVMDLQEPRSEIHSQRESLRHMATELELLRMELEAANRRVEDLASTDALTGLKNHRIFQERLELEFQRSVHYHAPLSVVLLDVDRFRSYNDTFGHPMGDRVLAQVAHVLQRNARSLDMVARYGGEEFVILLPDTDEHGAKEAAERLRAAIEAAPWPRRAVTASLGVATMNLMTSDPSDLLAEAEKALARAKRSGRNCVCHADRRIELKQTDELTAPHLMCNVIADLHLSRQ